MTHASPSANRRAFARIDLIALILAAPFLLFPGVFRPATVLVLALLGIVSLLRWAMCGDTWPKTPFNLALLLFCLAVTVAIWASALPDLTIPKLTGLILGLAVFRAIAFYVTDRRGLDWALSGFLLVALMIWGVGVLATGWAGKMALLQPIVSRLPRILTDLPGSPSSGINANQLAGAMTIYLSVALGVLAGSLRTRHLVAAALSAAGLLLAGGTLLLTQSRSGWIGGAAGVGAVVIAWAFSARSPKLRILAVVPLLLGLVGAVVLYISLSSQVMSSLAVGPSTDALVQGSGAVSLSGRVEIWSRAIYAIQDFPFTGTGLGTFRQVVNLLYPLFSIGPDVDIAHAHNIFLQVGVDLGLPGLIAYCALLVVAVTVAWTAGRRATPGLRDTAFGLLGGLVGLHVYGAADAMALGSKPGIAFWLILGLIAALPGIQDEGS